MRVARSGPPVLLLALGAAALAGSWPWLPAALMTPALLWLPGAVLARRFDGGGAGVCAGPGCFALAMALSLAILSAATAPLYLLRAPLEAAPLAAGAAFVVLAAGELWRLRGERDGKRPGYAAPRDGARRCEGDRRGDTGEWAAFALAVALLLPALLRYGGGNVDDWWDLAFVRSWIEHGRFSFDEPFLGSGRAHPRFLWSAWLTLQAIVGAGRADELWRIQAGPLAGVVCVAVVSAFAAFARALFGRGDARTIATIAVVPAWLWASEEIPFFARAYQDKLVAAFAMAPLLLALVVELVREPARGRRRPRMTALALVAAATVSVHSLIYTMTVFAALLVVASVHGRRTAAWLRSRGGLGLIAALGVPALYPLGQAVWLAAAFGAEGISLAQVDNPVVRAHLALGRILGAGAGWDGRVPETVERVSALWIVHPGAVFAPIAVLALPGLALAWATRRRAESRIALALTLVPALLLFVPGLAALAGRLWVPWMLYRLGWLVPVAALIGAAIGEGMRASPAVAVASREPMRFGARVRAAGLARTGALVLGAAAVGVAYREGADRLRRDMAEHPGPASRAPRGNSLAVFRFLAQQSQREGTVLAPPGFSELTPALAGKSVVAFTERGTLVFALDERNAYQRLRDRAQFFSATATPAQRDAIAARYDARWAVLPRRLVAAGSEERWIRRFGAESLLAAHAADQRSSSWSSDRAGVGERLGERWRIVLENRDWFVVANDAVGADDGAAQSPRERDPDRGFDGAVEPRAGASEGAVKPAPPWLAVLGARPAPAREDAPTASAPRAVLASVASSPGSLAGFEPPPQVLAPVAQPIWTGGSEPWEDVPSEATITMDIGAECVVAAVRVIPYAPRPRREAFEVVAGRSVLRTQAVHDRPLDLELDAAEPRSRVTLHVRSLLGNPISLRDVQLLGDPSSCGAAWPLYADPRFDILEPGGAVLQRLAFEHPSSGRPLLSLAHRVSREGRKEAARALLREATRREPSLVQAWIDLGFSDDGAGDREAGLADFTGAMRADSHSAWAHGCAAWARYRSGHTGLALWHALRARSLDPYYADGWTLLAYVAHRAGLDALAERCLDSAQRVDRQRNWPLLARAEFAVAAGNVARAREILVAHLGAAPFDLEARARLRDLDRRSRAAAGEQ